MTSSSGASPKKRLRRQLRQQRQALAIGPWQGASEHICRHLAALPLFQQARTVVAYVSHQQEPSLAPLWENDGVQVTGTPQNIPPSTTNQRQWGFPRCVEQHLSWHSCTTPTDFHLGSYGILEPQPQTPILGPTDIDLILVPAVACDHLGFRLGYGGGYYDRLLSHPDWQAIPTIGITFAFAYLEELPTDPWDQSLSGVCTEQGAQLFG